MKSRFAGVLVALVLTGCGSPAPPQAVTVTPVNVTPGDAAEVTAGPAPDSTDCGNREASLPPLSPLPSPGAMPPGSTMAAIFERGRLIVGVDQDTALFGARNPATGQLEGFDIDLARELAHSIFGDPNRLDLKVITSAQRDTALERGDVDMVVRTYSITCDRKKNVNFSTTYFLAQQRILVPKGSGIQSAADLSGKRVCALPGTTSLTALLALNPRPKLYGPSTWTDCLVMLQQGQIDAISTDDAVLAGLKIQDPNNVELVGESLGPEPYGVGIKKENDDLVRFVNGVLQQMRDDGRWQSFYDRWLSKDLGPSPGPPIPHYAG